MIYLRPSDTDAVDQGDVLDDCPLIWFDAFDLDQPDLSVAESRRQRVVVLTQTCDLAQRKVTRVVVAVAVSAADVVTRGQLKRADVVGAVRSGRVFGWYFLPADRQLAVPELIVDLRNLHTVPREVLEDLCRMGKRMARVQPLYREHLAKHFGDTYSRIGLPEPYATE